MFHYAYVHYTSFVENYLQLSLYFYIKTSSYFAWPLTPQHTSLSTDYVNNYIDFDLLPCKLSVPDEYTFHASNLFVYLVPLLSDTLNLDSNLNVFLLICRSSRYYKTWVTCKENVRPMETLAQCTSHYPITLIL